ncbi:hypothetical protein AJ80_07324 [Polytolypa hystricis UAMH7299]|uniref:Uncharacterized protein n=1 Tax=Polytolypa hystricis (strain UAMH7299) TaxID=1447883 RepID=A0A2B7XR37_POLH7|nr:hypothetical protein AJ80_07324 [Polytolypa hystricis UAMH7299]
MHPLWPRKPYYQRVTTDESNGLRSRRCSKPLLYSGLAILFISAALSIRHQYFSKFHVVSGSPLKQALANLKVGEGFVTGVDKGFDLNTMEQLDTYVISMFHQLHCLQALFNALFSKDKSGHGHEYGTTTEDAEIHLAHCIDYI